MSHPADFVCKVKPHPSPLFFLKNSRNDGISTKLKWEIYNPFTLYFEFWRYIFLIKIHILDIYSTLLFLIVLHYSFYISRYHFVQLFKTSINIALTKKLVRFYCYPHKKVSQDLTEKKQDFTEMSIILMVLTEI